MWAMAVRYIIMAAIQLGMWYLIEKFGLPLFNKAVENIMITSGVSEETAKDIMANKILLAFEEVGMFAVTSKTKLPVKVAEYLGFTSKGWAKRKIAAEVETKILAAEKTAATIGGETENAIPAISKILANKGIVKAGVAILVLDIVAKTISIPTQVYALAQYIDYANWQGPYQPFFQKLLTFIGIPAPTPLPRASVISPDNWKRIYATIEELKPLGVSFPFSDVDKPYSNKNLADLVDEVAANILKNGGQATFKTVFGAVLPLIQLTPAHEQTQILIKYSQNINQVLRRQRNNQQQ